MSNSVAFPFNEINQVNERGSNDDDDGGGINQQRWQ